MALHLYSASAGSGKTFTLTLEYIKLALRERDSRGYFRRILAVTFTTKAAEEMRTRIIQFLTALADINITQPDTESQAYKNLVTIHAFYESEQMNISKEEICQRAKVAIQQILQDYGLFSVMTIDSFVQRLSSTFIEELNLPSQFEVLLDANQLMHSLIDQLMEKVNRLGDPVLTELIINFAKTEVGEGRNWNMIRKNLHDFLRICLAEDFYPIKGDLDVFSIQDFNTIEFQIRNHNQSILDELHDLSLQVIQIVDGANIRDDAFFQGNKSAIAQFRKFSKKPILLENKYTYLRKSVDTGNWAAAKADDSLKAAIDQIAPELNDLGQSFLDIYDTHFHKYQFLGWIAKDIKKLALLTSITEELHIYQDENAAVSISEFSKRLYDVISNDPIPFIYEKLGDRYFHILIDEFQDTSILQWQNFMPLLENSISLHKHNLVVGDAKQSIYKFRGGEVGLIAALSTHNTTLIAHKMDRNPLDVDRFTYLMSQTSVQNLDCNYRSSFEIVDFNNHFFEWIATNETYQKLASFLSPIYGAGLEQKPVVSAEKMTGKVDLLVLSKPLKSDDTDDIEPQWMFDQTIALIHSALADGFSYTDIAILTRKNKQARYLAIQLKEKGYPIISSDSLLVHYSTVVVFIMTWLRLKQSPFDSFLFKELVIQQAEMNNSLVNNEQLRTFKTGNVNYFIKSLTHFHETTFSPETDRFVDFTYAIIDVCKLMQHPEGTEYLFKFLDILQEFVLLKSDSLDAFITYYDVNKASFCIASPLNADAITISSIHKSKGLEYPIVILPFASWTHQASNEHIWYTLPTHDYQELTIEDRTLPHYYGRVTAKEIASFDLLVERSAAEKEAIFLDALNMLYVALTRPKQYLHILLAVPHEKAHAVTKRMFEDSLGRIILDYAESITQFTVESPITLSPLWIDETRYFVFRSNQNLRIERKDKINRIAKRIDLKTNIIPAPAFRVNLSKDDLFSQAKQKRAIGNEIHDILAKLKGITDWPKLRIKLGQSNSVQVIQTIDSLLENQQIASFFVDSELLFVERDLLRPDGEILRPDRVIQQGNETIIVDFKTGAKQDKHIEQISGYKVLLASMGYQHVKGVLLYVETSEIVYV